MAIWNDLSGILNTDRIGTCWQPKDNKIRVGRDVSAFTSTTFSGQTTHNTVIGNGDDVTLKSKNLFDQVKTAAQNGFSVKQFRSISDQELKTGTISGGEISRQNGDYSINFSDRTLSIKHGDYTAQIQDGTLTIHKKHEKEGQPPDLVMKAAITDDARLTWNKNGEPELLTGNAARTKGVLQAQSDNEVILSLSGSDVEAGEGTVVWNLSGKAGTYSGGNNVTYLGTYEGGNFTDTEGKVTFDGYYNQTSFSNLSGISEFSGVFEQASIALEKGQGTFSGYFSASEILGATTNTMSGLFLNACTVRGGVGDDNFNGRFIGANVDGGEGDNSFGYGNLSLMRELTGSNMADENSYLKKYKGVEADFINATVTAGSGKDRINGVTWGSSFDLGEGDDSTSGVFSKTVIKGGEGNDTLRAEYAVDSTFDTGDGDDSVTLKTAISNNITTGDGTNTLTMGLNKVPSSATTWQTRDEQFALSRPRETGELADNTINASQGDSVITLNNGETSRKIIARDSHIKNERETDEAETKNQSDKAVADKTKEEELPSATHKTMSIAVNKYREILGMEPQSKGDIAATIDFGNGSVESFMSAKREARVTHQKENEMIQTVRRYASDGSISWKHWQRMEN